MPTDLKEIAGLMSSGGLLMAFLIVVVAGYKQKWCYGWQLNEMREDRNFWRDMRLRELDVTERVIRRDGRT